MGSRPLVIVAIVVVTLVVVTGIVAFNLPKSAEQREQIARELMSGVTASASANAESLLATGAFADFGVGNGIKLVRVRIVDDLNLHFELAATKDIALAEAPRVCLVGPYSAPDDAGLEDRCWGEPDISAQVDSALVPADGQRVLRAGSPIAVDAQLRRGETRCDYSPGDWLLQVKLNPLVDGTAAGARYLDDVEFEIPVPEHGPLQLLLTDKTRYCGLATVIYTEQGEPEVAE